MKKIVLLWLLISCNSKQIKEVVSYYENGNPQIIKYTKVAWGDTILIKKQELHKNGHIKFQTEFNMNSSKCSSYLESGQIIEEKYFTNGQLDSINHYISNENN